MALVIPEGRAADVVDRTTGEVLEEQTVAVAPIRRQPAPLGGLLRPVAPPDAVLEAQEATRRLIETTLREGRDYGTVPGSDEKRKVLYKAGAERVNAAFAVYPDFEIVETEIDHDREITYTKRRWDWHPEIRGKKIWREEHGTSRGLYRYVLKCYLIHRETGAIVATGVGSCSTLESKYVDRPRDLENTVFKMAKKRAYVDATLTAYGLSDQFTQDIDEMEQADGEAPRQRQRATRQAPAQAATDRPEHAQEAAPNGAAPASERQTQFIRRLLAERDVDEATREATDAALGAGALSRAEAHRLIAELMSRPKLSDDEPGA